MADFITIFAELKSILLPYAQKLITKVDLAAEFSLDTRHLMKNKKPLWFGGVKINKNYVSYHLMPVYINLQLLETISPELKNRMQGKSCFNFTKIEQLLF